jgi:hypothetical protein
LDPVTSVESRCFRYCKGWKSLTQPHRYFHMNNDADHRVDSHFQEMNDQPWVEIVPAHALITHLIARDEGGITLAADLDPMTEPFLRDHRMNGIALLPGVMGIEGFCTAAKIAATMRSNAGSGWHVSQVEDVQFLLPVKFYRDQSRRIQWVVNMEEQGDRLLAQVRLEATMTRYGRTPETNVHFTGKVILERENHVHTSPALDFSRWNPGLTALSGDEIYRLFFHGPAFRVLESAQKLEDGILAKLNPHLPALTAKECHLINNPVWVELCLQAAGICEIGRAGLLALPKAIESLKLLATAPEDIELYAKVTQNEDVDGRMRHDMRLIDISGNVYLEIVNYQTQTLPYVIEDERLRVIQDWFK